jgi:DNA transformation protein
MSDDSFCGYILEQLRRLNINCRPMFGGYGLYAGENIFGIIFQGQLFFATNDETRGDYIAAGMRPFRPNVKQRLKSYYEVPADVVEHAAQLEAWARRAIETKKSAARSTGKKRPPKNSG